MMDQNKRLIELNIEAVNEQSIIDNIYIGRVSNIVKGINVAFINIGLNQDVFMQIDKDNRYIYTNAKDSGEAPVSGDELLVQITKEAYMNKAPAVSSHISFPGKYCILTYNKCFTGISTKIRPIFYAITSLPRKFLMFNSSMQFSTK